MFVYGHCVTSRIENELAVVTYRLVKEHQACGLKGLVFDLDMGGYIEVIRFNYRHLLVPMVLATDFDKHF